MASVLLRNHDGGMIRQASREDFPAILKLQLLAFGEVAERLGLASIPPLEQTLEHLREEARNSVFFKYTENSRIVVDLMREMNREHNITFVFTTHDPRLLDHVDRKILLRDGNIASDEVMA